METLYETAFYIEARDLAVVPAARGNPSRIPTEFGTYRRFHNCRRGGICPYHPDLDRTGWQRTMIRTLDFNRFCKAGRIHLCLRCPSCRKSRKRLYLRPSKADFFTVALSPFGFVCEDCAGANL